MNSNRLRKFLEICLDWLKSLALSVAVLALVLVFIRPTSVINSSMAPNFLEDDRLLISTKSAISRGDVVIFDSGLEVGELRWSRLNPLQKLLIKPASSMNLIKRVIALPGEHFKLDSSKIYIDGQELVETYARGSTLGEMDLLVPEDSYLVLGDNRENSLDSRDGSLGLIDKKDIKGKVFFRYWPLSRIKYIGG